MSTKELRTTQVLDSLNEIMGPHVFPQKADGGDPRGCPKCGQGQLSLKLGKFGAFIGCSNYPECNFTRQLSATEAEGPRVLGQDPDTEEEISVRDGRYGPYVQRGDGKERKMSSLPKGTPPDQVTLEMALALLSLPREVAKHPESGDPIKAGIGRFGPYVQHGKVYASLSKDDDVLTIGPNRAIDLIIAKESGAGRGGGGRGAPAGREIGQHPDGGPVTVHAGRYGPYVKHGSVNATLPKSISPENVTLEDALPLLAARAEASGKKKPARKAAAKKAPAKKAAAKKEPAETKAAAKKPAAKKPAAKKAPAKKAPAKKAASGE